MFKKNPFIFGLFFLMFILSMGLIFAYDINITFYDESTLSEIPEVTITDANTSVYTSDVNGLWQTQLAGAKDLTISKTGYDSRPLEFYFNADANYNFMLNPTGFDSSIGFIVKDSNNNLWTNKYLQFQEMLSLSNLWNISTASFTQSFSVSAKEAGPSGITFKSDGTKMYIIGTNSDSVHQYTLSTAWDISTASFTQSFSVVEKETIPHDVTFKFDGTEMYIIGETSDSVHQYTLSTAWDISTASFTQSFSVSAKEVAPSGITFKSDGIKMYIIGRNSDSVHQYTLSTAWNISTASFTQSFSVSAKESQPSGITFKSDGTEMYIIGETSDSVHQYTLSTAWDISTASFTQSFSVSAKETNPNGITFKFNGSEMYIIGTNSDSVHQYNIGTGTPAIINSLLTSSSGIATANISSTGDYNALLYTADGNLTHTYTKTNVTVNKPKEEINPSNSVSPYDITVNGLLEYSLTNQTASSVDISIFAGAVGNYIFTVADYNANPLDRQYLERSYIAKAPMGSDYVSSILYQPYLIGVTDVIVPRIYVLDQLTRTIQDAEVYISTSINFVDTVVESGLTDSGGVFQFSAIPLKNYYVSIYYLGEFRGSFLIKPRTSDDVFYVTIDRSTTEDTSNTFIIDIDLSETKENVSTDENVSVIGTITANYNYINSYTIQAYQGSSLKYEDTILATGTSIDINKTIDFNLFEPYYDIRIVVTANYSIGGVSGTQSANKRIMISNQIDKISLFRTARQELGQPLAIILALIITAIILAIITLSGLPIAPAVTGLFGITILGVFMFLGWLDIGVVILGIDIGKLMYLLLVGISIYMLTRIGSV